MAYTKTPQEQQLIVAQVILKAAVDIEIHNAAHAEKPGPVDPNAVRATCIDLVSVFRTTYTAIKGNGKTGPPKAD